MLWDKPLKEKTPSKGQDHDSKDKAAKENREAAEKLREALRRLGPVKDASDLLKGAPE